jgi:dynein heavy chain
LTTAVTPCAPAGAGQHAAYLQWFSHLPLNEAPQVFGLHPNALVTRDLQDTKLLLDSLLLTQSQVGR